MRPHEDLINMVKAKHRLKNDAALSRTMHVKPSVISKLRNGKIPISAALLISFHELTDISIADLKVMTGYKNHSERTEKASHV